MLFKRAMLLVCAVSIFLPLAAGATTNNPAIDIQQAPARPKNIIIMIGDGMGPEYTSAYRYYQDNPNTEEVEETVFDRLLVGMASTYPARVSGYVTDSAASATALSSGIKTYNGAIGVDEHKKPISSIMQIAKKKGMSTGVAVKSQVNHATPAGFLAHNESRQNYVAIAESYIDTDADVILGGGQRYFSETLINKFKDKGYQYITELSQLDSVKKPKVLGLFADIELPLAVNDKDINSLTIETKKAISLLSQNPNGFVLLVEGSLIDWGGHDNDIVSAMGEMEEFANTIEVVEQYVRDHPDTLVVITADHNTGGLSIGANGVYAWDPQLIKGVNASPKHIAEKANEDQNWQQNMITSLGFTPDSHELQTLADAREEGTKALTTAIKQLISLKSNTGWTSGGHTGVDVQVFADGPGANLFRGHQDNTDIAKKMISLLP
ncbi:alkaline phosphatase [Shewanella surugensis]|uniref:Alkaline phosphatase n=1 Tax=Shewanella surugensis TaxID=212020 RepID=A0ABT0L8P7_9GAMM|nr:alkaline phosphatase [Shewanella surugensis]MCL1124061.1 alkaline phosphatase [Shewanella surugensis]